MKMLDFHMHSLLSDGVLLPSEIARRAEAAGCECIAITDHADMVSMETVIPSITATAAALNGNIGVFIIPGVEITHVPPAMIPETVEKARSLGAKIVAVHGETIVEPVLPGTNAAAVSAGAEILAHPGLIGESEVKEAARKGIFLEISGRSGHSYTNGHVAAAAIKHGARMCYGSDSHSPADLTDYNMALKILRGAGIDEKKAVEIFSMMREYAAKLGAD